MNSLCSESNYARVTDVAQQCRQQLNHAATMRQANDKRESALVNFLLMIKAHVIRKYNQRIDRQAFNYLLTLDESLLKDIGVTRQDIQWASQLPLSEDASAKIEELARRR